MSDSENEMVVESENHEDEDDSHDDDEVDSNDNEDDKGQDDKEAGTSTSATKKEPRQVYLPGHQMEEDESLVFDPSAYHMMHDIDSGLLQCLLDCQLILSTVYILVLYRFTVFEF